MTGPGTNSYLVGGGRATEWAVIDPGPAEAVHIDAIPPPPGAIRWIFATTPTSTIRPVARCSARSGATMHGRIADHPEWQDASFAPEVQLKAANASRSTRA